MRAPCRLALPPARPRWGSRWRGVLRWRSGGGDRDDGEDRKREAVGTQEGRTSSGLNNGGLGQESGLGRGDVGTTSGLENYLVKKNSAREGDGVVLHGRNA